MVLGAWIFPFLQNSISCLYMTKGDFPEGFVASQTVAKAFLDQSQRRRRDQLLYILESGWHGSVILFYLVLQSVSFAVIIVIAARS